VFTGSAWIAPQGDVDYHRIVGLPGALARIDVDAFTLGSDLDSLLGVFDSALVLLDSSNDDPAPGEALTLDSYVTEVFPADGILYVAVAAHPDTDFDGVGGLSTGAYELVTDVGCAADSDCDDGSLCNGSESCDPTIAECLSGPPLPAIFPERIVAPNAVSFTWTVPADVMYVRGGLAAVSSYDVALSSTLTSATAISSGGKPPANTASTGS